MMKKIIVAMTSLQGTACSETALYADEDTPKARAEIEKQFCDGSRDAPIAGSWINVSDNDAFH